MAKNLISPASLKNIKPKEGRKLTKFHDGEGLYLWVYDDGKKQYKRWFFRYRFNGINKPEIMLGSYPATTISEARATAESYRELLKNKIDPAQHKKNKKLSGNFETVAREWWAVKMDNKSESHKKRVLVSLVNDVFPFIGNRPIGEITTPELLSVLKRVEDRGAEETAHRIKSRCSMVFEYAIASGKCDNNPAAHLSRALRFVVRKHMAAPTTPEDVAAILKVVDGYNGSFVVRCALKLAPMFFVRPGELRNAEWKDFDFVKKEWSFVATKTNQQHIVPLCKQAIKILTELKQVTGDSIYVFPGVNRGRAMSNNAILAAYRRMGLTTEEVTGHGWRATARTLLDEVLGYPPHIIEQQLAHVVRDPLGRAYNRTKHLEQRREMMQAWADYLDRLNKK